MRIIATFTDAETGAVIDQIETDLRRFCNENVAPPQHVIRAEMRELGVYTTQSHGIRCELRPPPARRW